MGVHKSYADRRACRGTVTARPQGDLALYHDVYVEVTPSTKPI